MLENEYYTAIKGLIINNEVNKSVKNYFINKSDLETKYNIGKLLSEAGKHYGEGIIKKYSIQLSNDLNIKNAKSNLYNMLNFYKMISNNIFQTVSGKLNWSHYLELLPLKNKKEINYYIRLVENNNLSVRELRNRIKSKEYERLSDETKNKLITNESLDIKDTIPEPIIIPNPELKEEINEKYLQSIIVNNIEEFMEQLGEGYSFIRSEYKIKINDKYNYIDILLFNIKFNCYVVVELKVTELKKEYLGQIEVYMNYIDKHLKTINQNKTIGILLVKENNEYSLYSSDGNIIIRNFKLLGNK